MTPIVRAFADPHVRMIVGAMGSQMGKALALDTPIPTPDGWTTMADVWPGDYLFDDQGNPSKVTAVSEIQHNRKCYAVEFDDGDRIIADADHRWRVFDRKLKPRLWTTEEIKKRCNGKASPARIDVVKPSSQVTRRSIVSVTAVDSVPVKCLAIDSPSNLFLAGKSMIPTHNTEALFNVIGWRFTDSPTPALYIGPTEKQVSSVSRDRIAKMLRSTPILYDRLAKGQRDRITEKWISGVRLGFAWAGSATELASHPAGLVLVDERDRMIADVGGEGDPVTMARARTKNYLDAKTGVFSTPTIEGASPIMALFDEGTCEMWAWHCPHCNDLFIPKLAYLEWPEGVAIGEVHETTTLTCPECGASIEDRDKTVMNENGRYIPHRATDDGEYVRIDELPNNSTRSFWVSGLASPWQTFGDVAELLVQARKSGEEARIQAVTNTYGGEVYRAHGETIDAGDLERLKRDYRTGEVPRETQVITCGVDVQRRGLFYVIRGWGYKWESWLIERGYLVGETVRDPVWTDLYNVLAAEYGVIARADGSRSAGWVIKRSLIDSGYTPGQIGLRPESMIYRFCQRTKGRAFPTKGRETLDRGHWKASVAKNAANLIMINTDSTKTWLYERFQWPESEPGGFHVPKDIDADYLSQLASEEVITKPSGRRIWIRKRGHQNHYLDCEVLAFVAAVTIGVGKLDPLRISETNTKETKQENNKLSQKRQNRFDRKTLF